MNGRERKNRVLHYNFYSSFISYEIIMYNLVLDLFIFYGKWLSFWCFCFLMFVFSSCSWPYFFLLFPDFCVRFDSYTSKGHGDTDFSAITPLSWGNGFFSITNCCCMNFCQIFILWVRMYYRIILKVLWTLITILVFIINCASCWFESIFAHSKYVTGFIIDAA